PACGALRAPWVHGDSPRRAIVKPARSRKNACRAAVSTGVRCHLPSSPGGPAASSPRQPPPEPPTCTAAASRRALPGFRAVGDRFGSWRRYFLTMSLPLKWWTVHWKEYVPAVLGALNLKLPLVGLPEVKAGFPPVFFIATALCGAPSRFLKETVAPGLPVILPAFN